MFGAGYDAGALLDTPEASQEATQAVGDDSDPLPAPLAAAGAAPEAEQEAVWGEINPEKLAQARRIQPGASVPDLEGWGALKPGKKQLLSVLCERLHHRRGQPRQACTKPMRPAKKIYKWLKDEPHPVWLRPQCLTQRSSLLLASHHQGSHSPPVESPPGLRPTVLAVVPPAACRAARSWAHMASPQTRWQRVEVRKPHLGMGCVGCEAWQQPCGGGQ